ncbi:MAG: NAD(P)H-hydrate epimerase, partial [Leptospiraceae bacterium]|nr:NAD(P)H-hydrate epimerase [Leptospiraceae bacterium]
MNGSDPETRAVTAAWIPLCSYARSRRIDQESQAAGLEETWLMGQAALSSAHAIRTDPDLLNAGTMHILCGPGNNGGDGLALAYMLIGMRHIIASIPALRIYQTGEARSSAAQFYAGLLREIAQSPIAVDVCLLPSSSFHFSAINNGDVIVDALLGTGQDRAPAGEIARLLAHVALARIRIACALLALDVPTGLREDRDTRFLNARELR